MSYDDRRCGGCGRFMDLRSARWFDYEWYCSDACSEPPRERMAEALAQRHGGSTHQAGEVR